MISCLWKSRRPPEADASLFPLFSYHTFASLTVPSFLPMTPVFPLPAESHLVNQSSLKLFLEGGEQLCPLHVLRKLLLNKSDFLPTNTGLLSFGFWMLSRLLITLLYFYHLSWNLPHSSLFWSQKCHLHVKLVFLVIPYLSLNSSCYMSNRRHRTCAKVIMAQPTQSALPIAEHCWYGYLHPWSGCYVVIKKQWLRKDVVNLSFSSHLVPQTHYVHVTASK